jgi:hypothetical protein
LYSQHYNLHPRTKALLKNLTSIELFSAKRVIPEKTIDIELEYNIQVFLNTEANILIYNDITISSLPLQIGDILILKGQQRKFENGKYKVRTIDYEKNVTTFVKLDKIEFDKVKDENDPRYVCVTDKNIKIKKLCESDYDILGNKKSSKDYWDRPCDINKECPFFQKNKNYKNYRGGCIDGYCEMPLGVKRLGFRNYEGKPFCHGCDDKNNPKCCNEQKNPDYAFVLDDYERLPEYREEFVETINDNNFINQNYNKSPNPNAFYNELDNEQFQKILNKLTNKKFHPNEEPVNFKIFLSDIINNITEFRNDQIVVYDVDIQSKVFSENDTKASYTIFFTIYREGKSNGKRLVIEMTQYIKDGDFLVETIKVNGIITPNEIKDLTGQPDGFDTDTPLFSSSLNFESIKDDKMFKNDDKIKEYICDKYKNYKKEYNIDIDCNKI